MPLKWRCASGLRDHSSLHKTPPSRSSMRDLFGPGKGQVSTDIPSLANPANLALLKDQCANGVPLKLRSAIPIKWPLSSSIAPAILRRELVHLIREQIA